jgi:cell division protein FtsX
MRSQRARDEQTVTIATTLVVFVLVLLLGSGMLFLASWAVAELSTGVQQTSFVSVLAIATSVSSWYLFRHRRR